MAGLPESALCKVFQKCEARDRCRLQLVCTEWLQILDPDNHLAWANITIALSDLSQSFVDWMAKRASSMTTIAAPLSWSAKDHQPLMAMYRLLYVLKSEAAGLKSLRLAMPDKHSAVMHEQVDALHSSRYDDNPSCHGGAVDNLLGGICDIEQLQELEISNLTAPDMSDSFRFFSNMTNLTSLNLAFAVTAQPLEQSQAQDFWMGICSVTTLQHLSVSNCKIRYSGVFDRFIEGKMPSMIGSLISLRTVEIKNCGLGTLPESFSQLRKLKSFSFLESPQDCSQLSSLDALTHLVVASQSSRACSQIPNLKRLKIIGAAPNSKIPHEVTPLMTGMWNCLEDLDLSGLNLREIPVAVTRMASLKDLSLRDNNLSSLSSGPYLETLEQLDVSRNNFERIPDALQNAQKLSKLAISGNEDLHLNEEGVAIIKSLPALLHLDLTKEFCQADDDFMDLDLCTGWGPTSLKCLASLRCTAAPELRIMCNV